MVHSSQLTVSMVRNGVRDTVLQSEDSIHENNRRYVEKGHRIYDSAFVVIDVYTAGSRDLKLRTDEIIYKVGCRCIECGYERPYLFGNSGCGNDDYHKIFRCECQMTELEITGKFFCWLSSIGRRNVNRTVPLPLPRGRRFHCFLSHDWSEGGVNHRIVRVINERLANKGIITWLDDQRIRANIRPSIDCGLRDSVVFIAFLTANYANKLQRPPDIDYCSYEYREAARLLPRGRLPVALEERMTHPVTWPAPLADLRDVLLTNMVGVDNNILLLNMQCDELIARIVAIARGEA
mmetsp:Transcript_1295/g.1360  ORF Transcript_1295/g.1360 Transcript_1295/m.1360 type:complete len:293 (-) Transcript_1295:270-1148(-)|eukprot:gene17120-19605_t